MVQYPILRRFPQIIFFLTAGPAGFHNARGAHCLKKQDITPIIQIF